MSSAASLALLHCFTNVLSSPHFDIWGEKAFHQNLAPLHIFLFALKSWQFTRFLCKEKNLYTVNPRAKVGVDTKRAAAAKGYEQLPAALSECL